MTMINHDDDLLTPISSYNSLISIVVKNAQEWPKSLDHLITPPSQIQINPSHNLNFVREIFVNFNILITKAESHSGIRRLLGRLLHRDSPQWATGLWGQGLDYHGISRREVTNFFHQHQNCKPPNSHTNLRCFIVGKFGKSKKSITYMLISCCFLRWKEGE